LLGTTADDHGVLERAFAEACATQGIVPGTAAYAHCMVGVHQARGQSAVDVFRGLFPDADGRAEAAALSFERSFRTSLDRTGISPVPGAEEAITRLSDSGVRVCLITSLSRRLLGLVLDALGWWRLIDLTLCPEDAPRGCPWPDLMLTAMLRLGVEDVRAAAFAGSTASEVQCGERAGASVVAGLLTGGHTGDRLRTAGATHLIDGIAQLPALLLGSSTVGATEPAAGASGPAAGAPGPAGGAPDPAAGAPGSAAGAPGSAASGSGARAMPTHTAAPPASASAASTAAPRPQVPLERRHSGL
jgi:phosphonatase-like hydrolase